MSANTVFFICFNVIHSESLSFSFTTLVDRYIVSGLNKRLGPNRIPAGRYGIISGLPTLVWQKTVRLIFPTWGLYFRRIPTGAVHDFCLGSLFCFFWGWILENYNRSSGRRTLLSPVIILPEIFLHYVTGTRLFFFPLPSLLLLSRDKSLRRFCL